MKSKIVSIKGNKLTIDFDEEERSQLFRMGLQLLVNDWGYKVVVLAPSEFKFDKKPKSVDIKDIHPDLEVICLTRAVNQALRDCCDRRISKPQSKVKKQ